MSRALSPSSSSALIPSQSIELLPIGNLRSNPRNARTHSKKQINSIARSLQSFGFLGALLIDEANNIICGHGRYEAAKLCELKKIPVVRCEHLTETQKRLYAIADNRLAEQAGWDRDILAVEFGELIELSAAEAFDVELSGFETAEIDLLFAEHEETSAPEDVLPPPPRLATTQPGDKWELGKHRLLCGDARNPDDFLKLLEGLRAAAVFCDPPFNRKPSAIGGRGRHKHPGFAFGSGEMHRPKFQQFLFQTLGNAAEVSVPGAIHYVFMDWRSIDVLYAAADKIYGAKLNLVVWAKTNGGQGSLYRSQHELIGVFQVGDHPHRNNVQLGRFGRNRSNVWTYTGINSFGKGRMDALAAHPTVKPIALVADALLDCTKRGDVVLDQFLGAGTLILAAEKTGRLGFGLEIDPKYVDVAVQRWQSLTKRDAILAGDGRTFDEVGAERRNGMDSDA